MAEVGSWASLGFGTVGSEVCRQLAQPEVAKRMGLEPQPDWVLRKDGVWRPNRYGNLQLAHAFPENHPVTVDDLPELPDVVFNALPGSQKDTSARLMDGLLREGVVVSTAEKGALADNFEYFMDLSKGGTYLGINSSFGGGAGSLSHMSIDISPDPANMQDLLSIPNGTLVRCSGLLDPTITDSSKKLLEYDKTSATKDVVDNGFAEPDAKSFDDIVTGEMNDSADKTVIFMDWTGLLGEAITRDDLGEIEVSEEIIHKAFFSEVAKRRFMVRAVRKAHLKKDDDTDVIGGFQYETDTMLVRGGFFNVTQSSGSELIEMLPWRLAKPRGGYMATFGPNGSDQPKGHIGTIAGPATTANRLIDDASTKFRALQDGE